MGGGSPLPPPALSPKSAPLVGTTMNFSSHRAQKTTLSKKKKKFFNNFLNMVGKFCGIC